MKKKSEPVRSGVSRRTRTVATVAGLVVASSFIWAWCFDYFHVPLSVPRFYAHDALSLSAWVKAAADGHILPFLDKTIPELGAPFGAAWSQWPSTEDLLFLLWGVFAKLTGNVNSGVALGHLLGAVASAVSFFLVSRVFRVRAPIAFVLALLFAFSPGFFYRQTDHLCIAYWWHVPWFVLVAAWAASRKGIPLRHRRMRWAIGAAVFAGIQNPYHLNFCLQLLVVGAVVRALRTREWRALKGPALVAGVALAVFASMHLDTVIWRSAHGASPGLVERHLGELDSTGLRPLDLLLPHEHHRIEALNRFQALRPGVITAEWPGPSLGFIGAAGLLALLAMTLTELVRRGTRTLGLWSLCVVWLIAYAMPGGLNALLGMFGLVIFRSSNRVSATIAALVLLFIARELSRRTHGWSKRNVGLLSGGLLAFGLFDQSPPSMTAASLSELTRKSRSDAALVAKLEARLPERARVFQFPAIAFPEAVGFKGADAHDGFRPYLYSHRLRFSFGGMKGRPEADWPLALNTATPSELATKLESFGFSALLIDRRVVQAGVDLRGELAKAGRTDVIDDELGETLVVFLNPAAVPTSPVRGLFPSSK